MKKIGIDVSDTSRPYIFQLLEREEPKSAQRTAEEKPVSKATTKPSEQPPVHRKEPVDGEKGAKTEQTKPKETRIVDQEVKREPAPSNGGNSRDFQIQRPPEKMPTLKEQIQPQKTESEIRLTEEQQEEDSENDVFLSESVGIDLTVDSEALQQFDYDESIEETE